MHSIKTAEEQEAGSGDVDMVTDGETEIYPKEDSIKAVKADGDADVGKPEVDTETDCQTVKRCKQDTSNEGEAKEEKAESKEDEKGLLLKTSLKL